MPDKFSIIKNTRPFSSAVVLFLSLSIVVYSIICLGASRIPFGGTLVLPIDEPVRTSNPIYASNPSEILLSGQLHETLLRIGKDGSYIPALAQTVPEVSQDGYLVTIKLRPGLEFHDGSPVDAYALVSSWKNLLRADSESPYWWLLSDVKGSMEFHSGKSTKISGLERVNSLTVRVRLKHHGDAVRSFFEAISSLPTALMPTWKYRKGSTQVAHPQGAGPFALEPGIQDGKYVLMPFAKHWAGRPFVQKVILRTIPNVKDRLLEFELGRLDAITDKPRRDLDKLKVLSGPFCRRFFLVFNESRIKSFPAGFRQAVMDAIDRTALADYVAGSRGKAMDEFFLPADGYESTEIQHPAPMKAKAYFKNIAQQRFGISKLIQLIVRFDSLVDRTVAERIQVDLVDAGVVLVVVPLDEEQYQARLESGDYDIRLEHMRPLVHSAQLQLIQIGDKVLGTGAVDDIVHWLDRLPESKSRSGIIRERARSLTVNSSWVPLFRSRSRWYVHKDVHDFVIDENGFVNLAQVWLAE